MKETNKSGIVALFGLFGISSQYWLSDYDLILSTLLMTIGMLSIGYLVAKLQKLQKRGGEDEKQD